MTAKTATFCYFIECDTDDSNMPEPPSQILWRLASPHYDEVYSSADEDWVVRETRYMVTSAVYIKDFMGMVDPKIKDVYVPETAAFRANADGEIVDWADLAMVKGSADHGAALEAMGLTPKGADFL